MAVWDSAQRRTRPSYSHARLAEAIFALDTCLQRREGVIEYSAHPACIFRLEIARARRRLALREGTRLKPGQRVARLHFWNEHIPPVPGNGTDFRWGRQMQKVIAISLRELACYLSSRPDLNDVDVVCGDVPSATREQWRQVEHIMAYYGFETVMECGRLSPRQRIHRFGENILISLLVFAQNPGALRFDTLNRVRVPIYLSRETLERKFGSLSGLAAPAREAS